MKSIYYVLVLFLTSCTAQYMMPSRPLPCGSTEVRTSFHYSPGKFSPFSCQFAVFHGVSDNDVVGTTLSTFLLPNNISYARYWDRDWETHQLQVHAAFFDLNYNPSIEIDYAYTSYNDVLAQNIKFGLGYMGMPLTYLFSDYSRDHTILPIMGYRFQHGDFNVDAQWIYGFTEYFMNEYKNTKKDFINKNYKNQYKRTISNSEIDSVVQRKNNHHIFLKTGDELVLRSSIFHLNFFHRATQTKFQMSKYSCPNYTTWALTKDSTENKHARYFKKGDILLELDTNKIFSDYRKGLGLNFKEDSNIVEKTIDSYDGIFWHDFFFSIGITGRH